jgi:hypothetical protein
LLKNEEGLAVLAALAVIVLAWIFSSGYESYVMQLSDNLVFLATGFVFGAAFGWVLRKLG